MASLDQMKELDHVWDSSRTAIFEFRVVLPLGRFALEREEFYVLGTRRERRPG
jgi:hypothetical protein